MSEVSLGKKIVLAVLLALLSLSLHAAGPVFVDVQYSATTIEQYSPTTMDPASLFAPQNYTPYSSGTPQQRPPQNVQHPQYQPYPYSNNAGYSSIAPYQSYQNQSWPGGGGFPGIGLMNGGMMPFSTGLPIVGGFPYSGGGLPMTGFGYPMMTPGTMSPGMGSGFPGFGGFPFSTGGW